MHEGHGSFRKRFLALLGSKLVEFGKDFHARQEKAWDAIEKSIKDLYQGMTDFLQYVRTNYLQIDLDELNETAWKRYVQFQKDFQKAVSREK
jgi:recombinational DNA repair ATPase RecF